MGFHTAFKHRVCNQLGISKGSFPFKYLGSMISDTRLRVADQQIVIRNAKARLSGWKASLLSQAGRVTLIPFFKLFLFMSLWRVGLLSLFSSSWNP